MGSHLYNSHSFDRNKDQEFSGSLDGHRLYLSERGEWIELERVGHWSAYQGSPNYWGCGEFVGPDDWECDLSGGHVRIMTDAEVATEYELSAILKRLAESLGTLNTKLPERMTRVKQRAELAARLLDALKS